MQVLFGLSILSANRYATLPLTACFVCQAQGAAYHNRAVRARNTKSRPFIFQSNARMITRGSKHLYDNQRTSTIFPKLSSGAPEDNQDDVVKSTNGRDRACVLVREIEEGGSGPLSGLAMQPR